MCVIFYYIVILYFENFSFMCIKIWKQNKKNLSTTMLDVSRKEV